MHDNMNGSTSMMSIVFSSFAFVVNVILSIDGETVSTVLAWIVAAFAIANNGHSMYLRHKRIKKIKDNKNE